jgi:hypothetical protein
VYPITPEGKVAAMVLMLLGIGLFSAITATATSYLISTGQPRDASRGGQLVEEIERLAVLREQGSLTERSSPRPSAGCCAEIERTIAHDGMS